MNYIVYGCMEYGCGDGRKYSVKKVNSDRRKRSIARIREEIGYESREAPGASQR